MIQTYEQLHQTVEKAVNKYLQADDEAKISFDIADNGSCAMTNQANGNKLSFMLAKFGNEFKVGYAFFEKDEPQPDWLDDVFNTEFDENFVTNLITEQLLPDPLF